MKEFTFFLVVVAVVVGLLWQTETELTFPLTRSEMPNVEGIRNNCSVISTFPLTVAQFRLEGQNFIGTGGAVIYSIRCPWWLTGKIASMIR